MRKWISFLMFALAVLLPVVPARGEDPGTVVVGEVRFVEIARAEANRLFGSTDYVLSAEQLRRLDALVAQKKATILAQPRIVTISGAQAQVRSVRELIYPTEYGDPSATESDDKTITTDTGSNVTVNVTINNSPTGSPNFARRRRPALIPQAFRTREVGIILNLTPTVDREGKSINCTLVPEVSLFGGYERFEGQTDAGKVRVPQPVFYTYNDQTSVVLPNGATALLAVHDCEHLPNRDQVLLVTLSLTLSR